MASQAAGVLAELRGQGARTTAPRRAVVAAALARSRPFTAQDLVEELEGTGRATVFRTLDLLVRVGALSRMHGVEAGERCVRFTRCEPEHHHHLRCRSCGRVEEIELRALERQVARVARRRGFLAVEHEVEIAGLCPRCR
ncbi:MAG: transcriptional repressor [Chloroflexi bacterium]|nr:transcriptional repressor [Chloroflexota bacterium]